MGSYISYIGKRCWLQNNPSWVTVGFEFSFDGFYALYAHRSVCAQEFMASGIAVVAEHLEIGMADQRYCSG